MRELVEALKDAIAFLEDSERVSFRSKAVQLSVVVDEWERKHTKRTDPNPVTSDAFLLHLIDVVWQTANEDESVPDTAWAYRMIQRARDTFTSKEEPVHDLVGCGGPWHYKSHSTGSVCPTCGGSKWVQGTAP